MCAARTNNESGVAQAANNLFKICARQILRLRDISQRDGLTAIHARKRHHEAHAVLAARAERDRTRSVQSTRPWFLFASHLCTSPIQYPTRRIGIEGILFRCSLTNRS
jgi:hypothetical protein